MGYSLSDLLVGFFAYLFVIVIVACLLLNQKRIVRTNTVSEQEHKSYKIGNFSIILIAIIFTLLNILFSRQAIRNDRVAGDRFYYSEFFSGQVQGVTPGLKVIAWFIHLFTNDASVFFYSATFLCVVLTLIAYKKSENALPLAILFLIVTEWFFSTYINLKQCYCSAFASLFSTYALKKANPKNTALSFLFIALACLFHVAGFILLVIYALMFFQRRKDKTLLYLWIFIFVAIFFKPLVILGATMVKPMFPSIYSKVEEYFIGDTIIDDSSPFAFLKGIPFYYLTVIGFVRKKPLSIKIKNYNNYLLFSMMASLCWILSIYNIWLYRLTFLFYLPVGIFFAQIVKNTKNQLEKQIDFSVVIGVSFLLILHYIVAYYINYGGFSGFY